MWQILLLSICLASMKFTVAEDVRVGEDVIGQLKYSPQFRGPLWYSSPSSNYPTRDYGERSFQVPLIYNRIDRQFEEPQTSPDNCQQVETLESILVLLKRILNQNDNTYVFQPDERLKILQSLKEYLERLGPNANGVDDHLKLKELINRADITMLDEKDASQQNISNKNKSHVEANFILKYDIPSINNVGCKEALAALIRTVKSAHLQMIDYCNQSGKCTFNSDSDSSNIQHSDKSNTLHSILTLDHPMSTQSKIIPSNQHSLNLYDVQNSINDIKTENQILTQKGSNNHVDPRIQPQSELHNNRFQTTSSLNSDVVQTLNNQQKNFEAYNNVYVNKKSESNIQNSDKSNFFNSILNFQHSTPTQVQITPANLYPLNINGVQSPLNNLVMPQNQPQLSLQGSKGYLNLQEYPELYLNSNQFLATSALNTGTSQIKNQNNQEGNKIKNNKYLNILNSYGMKRFLNTPTNGIKQFEEINKPLPLSQTQHIVGYVPINYNNEPDQQVPYKLSQVVNDKSASINKNKQNIKEWFQYAGASVVPRHEYNNYNYLSVIKPNAVKNFKPSFMPLMPSNLQINFDKFHHQNEGQLVNPFYQSNFNIKQNPYLSSINLNRQNSLNYNSQQADATTQSDFGLNLYAPTNLLNYPKHGIYGNKLFDLHRLSSVPNSVKLNSVADNEVVELTYKLKRPQSIIANPYYYVKFRMPYRDFVSKIIDLSKNPHLRSNPLKLHEELISVSNLAETSPDLKNVAHDEVSKIILNNGGTLINAKVLGKNDSNADQYLKTIQKLNANMNTNDILNLIRNDKTPYTSIVSETPVFRAEQNPYDGELSNENINAQYVINVDTRRLFTPLAHYDTNAKPLPMSFLPAKIAYQLSNPEHQNLMYTWLN